MLTCLENLRKNSGNLGDSNRKFGGFKPWPFFSLKENQPREHNTWGLGLILARPVRRLVELPFWAYFSWQYLMPHSAKRIDDIAYTEYYIFAWYGRTYWYLFAVRFNHSNVHVCRYHFQIGSCWGVMIHRYSKCLFLEREKSKRCF